MKDEHNVILILVSIIFSSLFRRFIKILDFSCSSFFPEFQIFLGYIISKLILITARLLPEFFSTFHFVWSFFYYRSCSWGLYMVVRQGFLSFFNCSSRFLLKSRSAKLYSKINMVFNTCLVLRSSSILHLAFQSAILSTLSLEMVLGHPWQFLLVFHDSQVVQIDIF